ncbi:MAG: hypothetical protein K9W42_10800 [Candidatus Heimdallarchaeota archaeon]|nr:hypothetical protein [Candidatus Heimdallarchaeota archaeon]
MKEEIPIADKIAQNIFKLAALEETIDKKISATIFEKERKKYKKIGEKTYAIFSFAIVSIAFLFFYFGEKNPSLLIVGAVLLSLWVFLPIAFIFIEKPLQKWAVKKRIGTKKPILQEIEKSKEFPGIFSKVESAFEEANESGAAENFLAQFYVNFLTELLITEEGAIMKEELKRVAFAIARGTFILEALNLTKLVEDKTYLNKLEEILTVLEFISAKHKETKKTISFIKETFKEMNKSIAEMKTIIYKLKESSEDRKFAEQLQKQTKKLREIVGKQPTPKSKIKEITALKGMKKGETLSTISALDDEIIEIRTRAGKYYISKKYFDHEVLKERRMFELLTDTELEIKIEVLQSTLEILDQTKENLSEEEYEKIKSNYLTQLFATKELLAKRKGKGTKIYCPYCGATNSTLQRSCKKCGKKLPYCIVCLNTIGKGTTVSICPHCQSLAHDYHFKEWLKKTSICPYCKKKVKQELKTMKLETIIDIPK